MEEIISYGRFQCRELAPHKNRGMEITFVQRGMMEWMVELNVHHKPGEIQIRIGRLTGLLCQGQKRAD